MKIAFPKQIKSDYTGYCQIINILYPFLYSQIRCDVIFDFSQLKWFDANLLPIIGACIEGKKYTHNLKYYKNRLSPKIQELWGRNGFGQYFDIEKTADPYNSTIEYSIFKASEGKDFGEYIDTHLLSSPELPRMSNGLRKQISLNIQEIFGNAPMHGNCEKVLSCGQHYPVQKKLLFTIVNLGNTIQENVVEYFSTFLKMAAPEHAISWAVIEDNSTKPMLNGKSGGKGLAYLNEFIKKNNGKLQICSGNEYWESYNKGETKKYLSSNFPGTIVTIQINLNDTKSYILTSEFEKMTSLLF